MTFFRKNAFRQPVLEEQMSVPEITVIICTYNRKDFLEKSLSAYKHQTFRGFEVIVTSDGSSDGTDEFMLQFRDQANFDLHYICQEDIGFRKSLAANKAIRAARGKYLVFADDDMIPPPHYLEAYRKIFVANAGDILIFSKYLKADPREKCFSLEGISKLDYMKKVNIFSKLHLLVWKFKYRKYIAQNLPHRPKLNGGNFGVSAQAMRAINGYDNEFSGWGYEDDDLRRRLLAIGTLPCEGVYSAWCFNLGYLNDFKTAQTAGDGTAAPENRDGTANKKLAYDTSRPARCRCGICEAEEARQLF